MEYRHEVRLTRTERAVEVGGAGRAGLQGGLDEVECLVKVGSKRLGDDVVRDRGLVPYTLGEGEDEVAVVDRVRDRDEVPQQHLVTHAVLHACALVFYARSGFTSFKWPS